LNVVANRKYLKLFDELTAGEEHYMVDILFISIGDFVKSRENAI